MTRSGSWCNMPPRNVRVSVPIAFSPVPIRVGRFAIAVKSAVTTRRLVFFARIAFASAVKDGAITLGKTYRQEGALSWGYLTPPDDVKSEHVKLTQRSRKARAGEAGKRGSGKAGKQGSGREPV